MNISAWQLSQAARAGLQRTKEQRPLLVLMWLPAVTRHGEPPAAPPMTTAASCSRLQPGTLTIGARDRHSAISGIKSDRHSTGLLCLGLCARGTPLHTQARADG